MPPESFVIDAEQAGATLAAVARTRLTGKSWTQVRRFIETRQACINGELCLDPARRLKKGDRVEILAKPAPKDHTHEHVTLRYLDEHIVVAEKPSGVSTVRHPTERAWSERRKAMSPTLQDIVSRLIAAEEGRGRKGPLPRLRVVQRLDKGTSGLVVFARSVVAERSLGKQFHAHSVVRRYLAVVPGAPAAQTITSRLVRDRGDGRRGSTREVDDDGKEAITHVSIVHRLQGYSVMGCRLETGRTHQIRIHLSELGHPVCGETVYNRKLGKEPIADESGAPRLALHAAELGLIHPTTGKALHWEMPLPPDLHALVDRLRGPAKT